MIDNEASRQAREIAIAEHIQGSLANFKVELERILNINNIDTYTNTPDFILAEMLYHNVMATIKMQAKRDEWYGKNAR